MGVKKPTNEDCNKVEVRFLVFTDVLPIYLLGCNVTSTDTLLSMFERNVAPSFRVKPGPKMKAL
jgi:hypothetical protein